MPDARYLLPNNATELERSLSQAMDHLPRLEAGAQLIRTAKRNNIPDSVIPYLIYEYGLGELLPYLEDPRTAISTGVLWQRLRGTPESFRIALSWIGNDGTIEESEGNTINWAQYQLGLASAPDGLSQTDSVVELSRLSSPVRSSLFRIYGGWYDGRRFKLDEHKLSGLDPLCDHTGVYLKPEWPQLSFGRLTETLWGFTGEEAKISVHRFIPAELQYEDRFILDQSRLDEFWHLLEQMQMSASRGHFIIEQPKPARPSTTWTDSPQQTWSTALAWNTDFSGHKLEFCKAGIYLGDGALLGETNACLPAYAEIETGDGPLLLSEFDPATPETQSLSGHLLALERQEILERFDRSMEGGGMWVGQYQTEREIFALQHGVGYTGTGTHPAPDHVTRISSLRNGNYTYNNRANYNTHIYGDGAGHRLGVGEEWRSIAFTSFADGDPTSGYPQLMDLDSLTILERSAELPNGAIQAQELDYRSGGYQLGDIFTVDLYGPDGQRRSIKFENETTAIPGFNAGNIYYAARLDRAVRRQHFIEDQAIPSAAAASAHRSHAEEFTHPQDVTTWSASLTWASGNGWQPLFRELGKGRTHVVESAGGTSTIESALDRTFSGSHAAPAAAFVLNEPIFLTGESVLSEDPSQDTVEIAASYSRRHTDRYATIGATQPTTWAGSTWQSAGDWAGTYFDNHIESQHSTVDSDDGAPVLAFNLSAEAARDRDNTSELVATGQLGAYSLHRTHTDTAEITTAGETWSDLGTWAEVTTWAGDAALVTSASRTHHVTEFAYSGFSVQSNALPATISVTAANVYNSGYSSSIFVKHDPADIADVQVGDQVTAINGVAPTYYTYVTKVWDGVYLGWLSLSRSDQRSVNQQYTYRVEVPAALDVEVGAAPVDVVETLFVHPDYFATPETWATTAGTWEDQSTWTPVQNGRARAHTVELPFSLSAESTNHASNAIPAGEIAYTGQSVASNIERGHILSGSIPFFRSDEIWRTDADWGQVYGWQETFPPATGHTRLRRLEILATGAPAGSATSGVARSRAGFVYPNDKFTLSERSQLSEVWHEQPHGFLYRTTVRTSVAYYPINSATWSATLPWAGIWGWTADFALPISKHSQD